VARWRLEGFGDALHAAGLDPLAVPVFECAGNTLADGHAAALELLRADPRPTALLSITDQLARGAAQAADELGLRVPEDLSLTGFDDLPEADWLTTVHQDHEAKGRRAARALLEGDTGETLLGTRLVVRRSTAPVSSG
jgi:DNA-binding LacI/PurR family transcriptional regulator